MKIKSFNHRIHYRNNIFDYITLDMETESKELVFRGVKKLTYQTEDGELFHTPAQVFFQLALMQNVDVHMDTTEPEMFNLQTVLTAKRDGFIHTITLNYHLLDERNKADRE